MKDVSGSREWAIVNVLLADIIRCEFAGTRMKIEGGGAVSNPDPSSFLSISQVLKLRLSQP